MDQISYDDVAGFVPKIEGMTKPKKPTKHEIRRVMKSLSGRRMAKITPERRSEIARTAARARWAKAKDKLGGQK